ncbi:unnamed protein product [Adineta steineri]|uniref:Condensation domain-containing protein n=1 Tax=Adineta steineri TaxID=433720 RepID=A0A819LMF3_9BILA|nr:unnamed protein product [Adineta steineri]
MPYLYRLTSKHTLSIKQLQHALKLVVQKHQSLRTSLIFDEQNNQLMQRIIDKNDDNSSLFTFIESTYETDGQLDSIMHDEKGNPHLFDLSQGLVCRCHLLYHKQHPRNDLLTDKDALIFNFHHALFDVPSMDVFIDDLNQAYTTGQLSHDDNTTLRYLDYAVIEQQMPMTGARMFWLDTLHGCQLDRPLSLPYDRHRLTDEHRSGRGTSVSFDFGLDLSHLFLSYASSNNIQPQHLILAAYYVFLFKLTNGERDLCIGINTYGRYREEFKQVIGMFVNAIPLRCQLDPHWSFHQLLEYVQEMESNSMKYSYFPLQRILDLYRNISKPAFLDTSFEFSISEAELDVNEICIGDSRCSYVPYSTEISEDEIMSKFDFILTVQHDLNTVCTSITLVVESTV